MTTLRSQLRRALFRAEAGSILWSLANHGSGILSILASAAAAFIAATNDGGLPETAATQIAALSGAAAALTAVRTFAGCAGKWRTNRKTRRALLDLQVELHGDETDDQRKRFFQIMDAHERGIVGAESG